MGENHPAYLDSPYDMAIRDAYKRFDEALENILACFDEPVNVIVASDQFQAVPYQNKYYALVNKWAILSTNHKRLGQC
jgi:hypothetical protein